MFIDALLKIWETSGFAALTWQHLMMLVIAGVLIYLAIAKKFEPLLLLPIAFGVLLANLPLTGLMGEPPSSAESGGLLYYLLNFRTLKIERSRERI
jgi:Na+-transporting methylmalonyl-CoA/oxaloacetate decarboxylase beta subunit